MKGLNPSTDSGKRNGVVGLGLRPDHSSIIINIMVCHDQNEFKVSVPSNSRFGDLKSIVAQKIGLSPETFKVLFRGKEKEDDEDLQTAGVKENSKVLIQEDTTCKQEKPEVVEETCVVSRGGEAVAKVREEVDKLSKQVSSLQAAVDSGTKVVEKEIIYLSEMLMRQLLKLDGIDAEGEGRVQRKMEVRRVQSLVDTVDHLKTRNSNPSSNVDNIKSETAQWESFEPAGGAVNDSSSPQPSSAHSPQPPSVPLSKLSSAHAPHPPSTPLPQPPSTHSPQPPSTHSPQPPSTHSPQPPSTPLPQPSSAHSPQPPSAHSPQPPSAHSSQPPSSHSPQPPSTHSPQPPSAHFPMPPSAHSPMPSYANTATYSPYPYTPYVYGQSPHDHNLYAPSYHNPNHHAPSHYVPSPNPHSLNPYAPLSSNPHAPNPYAPYSNDPNLHAPNLYASFSHDPNSHAANPYTSSSHNPNPYAPNPYSPNPYASNPYATSPHNPSPLNVPTNDPSAMHSYNPSSRDGNHEWERFE